LGGVEDELRSGERLCAGVLFDHAGERGLRGILHGIASETWFRSIKVRVK
jgi:hypothetical protein